MIPITELIKFYSTQVMAALMLAAEYLMFMPPDELAKQVAQYPTISKLVPAAAFLVWAAARAKKQAARAKLDAE